jgi:hypothetical protein
MDAIGCEEHEVALATSANGEVTDSPEVGLVMVTPLLLEAGAVLVLVLLVTVMGISATQDVPEPHDLTFSV